MQGSFRGGAPASGKARDSAADDGLSSLQIQRALSEQSDAEELAADVSRRQHAGDDDLLKNMSA